MQAEIKNYISLEHFSLRYKYFAFLDAGEYLADGLFIKHQVTVRFGMEYAHPDAPYRRLFDYWWTLY